LFTDTKKALNVSPFILRVELLKKVLIKYKIILKLLYPTLKLYSEIFSGVYLLYNNLNILGNTIKSKGSAIKNPPITAMAKG
jgi:hypothetical protein